jgi:DNA-binding response OmpR family regulator
MLCKFFRELAWLGSNHAGNESCTLVEAILDNGMNLMLVSEADFYGAEKILADLSRAGFNTVTCRSAQAGAAIRSQKPALIVVHLKGSGPAEISLCQELARSSEAPIVAISASANETFRASILNTTVDDFMVSPINPRELTARVKTILRRAPAPHENGVSPEPGKKNGRPGETEE